MKALDPEAAAKTHAGCKITTLDIGDIVFKYTGISMSSSRTPAAAPVGFEPVAIEMIEDFETETGMPVVSCARTHSQLFLLPWGA